MIRLLILSALGFAVGLFVAKLFSKRRHDHVINGEVVDVEAKPRPPGFLPVLLMGAVLAGIVLFVLPRFGISVMGVLQKAMAILPLMRGFLPF